MPKQLDLFTGAEIAPKTKTQKTKQETKTMKTKTATKTAKPTAAKPSAKIVKTATKTGHTLAAVAKDRPPVIVATIERKDAAKPAPKPAAAPVVKVSRAVAAANNKAIQAAAKEIKAKSKTPAPLPPKSWEALKIEQDAALTAAAPSATFRPKSAAGLIKVHALGLYIKPAEVAAYHAARRACAIDRAAYLRKYYATAFEAEIRAAKGDEATALAALGVNYHDDRGDGLLYVVRMKPKHIKAWHDVCYKIAGVHCSRVRAA